MQKINLAELILDFGIYPRADVEPAHVRSLSNAIEAGITLPPIVADKKSKRVVDGFHRHRAYSHVLGKTAEVDVILKNYKDDAALFMDAMRLNSAHGRSLSQYDRTHCIVRAADLGIDLEQTAKALSITIDLAGKLKTERTSRTNGTITPIKRTIKHMGGETLTQAQVETNDKLGGMDQGFYAVQLIMLIENDLIDRANSDLMRKLKRLAILLQPFAASEAA